MSDKLEDLNVPPRLLAAIRNEVRSSTEQQLNDLWMVVHSIKDATGNAPLASTGEPAAPVVAGATSAELAELKTLLEELNKRQDELQARSGQLASQFEAQDQELDKKVRGLRKRLTQTSQESPALPASLAESLEALDALKGRLDKTERESTQFAGAAALLETRLYDLENRLLRRLEALETRATMPGPGALDLLSDEYLLNQPSNVNFMLDDLVKVVLKYKARDLYVKADSLPQTLLNGELIPIGKQVVTGEDCRRLILLAIPQARRKEFFENKWIETLVTIHEGRFRLCAYFERDRLSATLKMLSNQVPLPDELGLPRALEVLALETQGLLVVAAPPHGGLSTTLSSLVDVINRQRKVRLFFLEEQIQFEIADGEALICQQEVGSDIASLSDGIRKVSKLGPDVVVVSDVPDAAALMHLLDLARTQALVIVGVRCERAANALEHLLEKAPPAQRSLVSDKLADCLRGVLAQKLVPRKDGNGSVLATELLLNNAATGDFLREGHYRLTEPLLERAGQGMHSIHQSLNELARAGTIHDGLAHPPNPSLPKRERLTESIPARKLEPPPQLSSPPPYMEPPPFLEPPNFAESTPSPVVPEPVATSHGRMSLGPPPMEDPPVPAEPTPRRNAALQPHAAPPFTESEVVEPAPLRVPGKPQKPERTAPEKGDDEALLGWL